VEGWRDAAVPGEFRVLRVLKPLWKIGRRGLAFAGHAATLQFVFLLKSTFFWLILLVKGRRRRFSPPPFFLSIHALDGPMPGSACLFNLVTAFFFNQLWHSFSTHFLLFAFNIFCRLKIMSKYTLKFGLLQII